MKYLDELYKLLANSPYILDIIPSKEEMINRFDNGELGIHFWPFQRIITLSDFIEMRLVMAERKRKELGTFPMSWNPEEFNIYFDGALFLTYASIESIPIYTDLGKIVREFLGGILSKSDLFDVYDGIGPTPIHPYIYFVKVKKKEQADYETDYAIPAVMTIQDDILIVIPDNEDLKFITRPLVRDMQDSIRNFYIQRLSDSILSDTIDDLEIKNKELSIKLAEYFKLTFAKRVISRTSKEIRELLSDMHISLQELSDLLCQAKNEIFSFFLKSDLFLEINRQLRCFLLFI